MMSRTPVVTSAAPTTSSAVAASLPLEPTLGRGDLKSSYKNFSFAVCSVILPPLAVFIKTGDGAESGINVLLWCLGVLPGVCHSLLVTQTNIRYSPLCAPRGELALNQAPVVRIEQAVADVTATPAAAAHVA